MKTKSYNMVLCSMEFGRGKIASNKRPEVIIAAFYFCFQTEDSDSSTSSGDEVDGSGSGEPDEPPRPGILVTAWVFIYTFFTSIIPQGPPQQFPAN